ncbi:MAG: thiolase family protein [Candidatus Thermoplasmatota archaeon]|nr:thiolase family protein [Candidatus Thermoplasmatota archaeon]
MTAVIVDWARSPFHRAHKGELRTVRPDDLASQVISGLIQRNDIDVAEFDDLILGCAYPEAEQGYNLGRLVTALSGFPESVPGMTINRLCGSSMHAILSAVSSIESGWGDCFMCAGVESMSRVKRRGFNWSPNPKLSVEWPQAYVEMGQTAENVAEKWDIGRNEQEEFALQSHVNSSSAANQGNFDDELIEIISDSGTVSRDGCIRPGTSLEAMSNLRPVFSESGTVTAATSSPLTDGAVALIVCSEEYASINGLNPLARIVSGTVSGCKPELMGIGPVSATRKLLDNTGWDLDSIDVIELNEAFSSQSLAVISELGIDQSRTNIDGGAISIGHPLGASGARITGKAASILDRSGSSRAIATMCIGGGMGMAMALERP